MVYKIAWAEISINREVHRTVKKTLDHPFFILFCKFQMLTLGEIAANVIAAMGY